MPTALVNDREIFYAARKLERRPALLLLHGAGGSHLDWPPELRRFESLGSCAIDLPGHGRSAKTAHPDVSAYADDVLELAEELDLSEMILVGHSMGGAIALDIALRQRDDVAALILVATGARLKVNETLLDLVDSNFTSAVDHIAAASWGPKAESDSVQRASQLMLACDPAALRMDFAACNDFDVMSRLGEIAIPSLVLVGTEDHMTPPRFGRYLAENIPDAEFMAIDGAGHMLALEQPQLVGDAVREFIHRRLNMD